MVERHVSIYDSSSAFLKSVLVNVLLVAPPVSCHIVHEGKSQSIINDRQEGYATVFH